MPPLFKSPLLYGLRFGECQRVCHRSGTQVLGLRIQMRVDIRRGRNIAVAQPLLNLLHRYALFQQQAGAGVAQIMEADPAQTIFFQKLRKARCHGIRLNQISHRIHKYNGKSDPAGFRDDRLSTVAEREWSAQDSIPRLAPLLCQPIAERGRTDEADSRVAGPQRYFHHSQHLRTSGFAVQELERPDDGKHADTARSAAHKEVVI